jgi:deoxyribodipyrimidine photo-lyase
MSREQRVHHNWALLKAQELAIAKHVPLIVVFCLAPSFLGATIRQYGFMLRGLQEIEQSLAALNISFALLIGAPDEVLPDFAEQLQSSVVVCDFDPLRLKRLWKKNIAAKLSVPLIEVDAHNIVPCRFVSQKTEFGAYTLRPKINRLLPQFLSEYPAVNSHPFIGELFPTDWQSIWNSLTLDTDVAEVNWLTSGERAATLHFEDFIANKLEYYDQQRNNPNLNGQSDLSPYLHFGQISAQQIAFTVHNTDAPQTAKDAFLEELIVRRELSDNFCFTNPNYDSVAGFPTWAQKTLNGHRSDSRDFLYSLEQFEHGSTHDVLWNAAQKQMTSTGKMHGYMRMYWAKKILEWSTSPEEALAIALYLNDKYELDGRDPNGYAGVAWSIGGVHDRAWFERPVYGKIRYMNANGCASKFDVKQYCKRIMNYE